MFERLKNGIFCDDYDLWTGRVMSEAEKEERKKRADVCATFLFLVELGMYVAVLLFVLCIM